MDIPYQSLNSQTLRALIEEFVTRDGTDYGDSEISLDRKVEQVMRQLKAGKIRISFDSETESCDLREVLPGERPVSESREK